MADLSVILTGRYSVEKMAVVLDGWTELCLAAKKEMMLVGWKDDQKAVRKESRLVRKKVVVRGDG